MNTQKWPYLPESVACSLHEITTTKTYKKGTFLYRHGESPKGLYFVFSGLVGLTHVSDSGKEHLFRVFGSGQCLGHRSLVASENYHASAKVLESAEIGYATKAMVEHLMATNHEFCQAMMKKLAQELRRAELRLASSSDKQVAERVAETMIDLKESFPDHKWTRKDIAHYCGTTGPSVIRSLAQLEELGFIRQDGREISIIDDMQLRRFARLD
ncbi:MAG: cyclic nucleotide-binding protein [Bdellovibrionaceae bacterium]|nr:cyclic nucleotide-binding protein [Pseudobdellovibrionaceae bacterium]